MTLRQYLTSHRAVKLYIVLSSAFIGVFLLDAFVMPWIVHGRGEIPIPDLVGTPVATAQLQLYNAGLNPVVAGTTPSATVKPGSVAFQNPEPGSVVREGRNVYLTVSGGEEQVVVPNLRGRSLRDAKITLEQLDLRVGMTTMAADPLPAENVISQSVVPGKRVAQGTVIDITVSNGPEATQLDVPNVVGLALDEAQRRLAAAGLRVGAITYKQSKSLLPNTVVAQSPSGGDKVDPNTPIDVTVVH